MSEKSTNQLDPELLEILVCPETKSPLLQVEDRLISTDSESRRAYKIEEGIPRMLVEDSEQLSLSDWEELVKKAGRLDLVKK